jgi:hypothetical protein
MITGIGHRDQRIGPLIGAERRGSSVASRAFPPFGEAALLTKLALVSGRSPSVGSERSDVRPSAPRAHWTPFGVTALLAQVDGRCEAADHRSRPPGSGPRSPDATASGRAGWSRWWRACRSGPPGSRADPAAPHPRGAPRQNHR